MTGATYLPAQISQVVEQMPPAIDCAIASKTPACPWSDVTLPFIV
jgi:hypothetical protein